MVVSLFCTGFASWIISPVGDDGAWNARGDVQGYEVEQRGLEYYGIGINGTGANDFRYATVSTPSGSVNKLTNKTLTVNITVDHSKMSERLSQSGGYIGDVLVVTSSAKLMANSLFNQIASYGLTYPSSCKLELVGYPNLFVLSSVTLNSDNTLGIRIPIEQIYNVAKLDKQNTTTSTFSLQLEFVESDSGVASANVAAICENFMISHTIHIEPK